MSAVDAAVRPAPARRLRALAGRGVLATLGAMAVAGVVAGAAGALGVDFRVEGDERIPVSGIVFQTGVFSLVGVVIAAALLRWSARPAHRFLWTTGTLTVLSLVPPVLWAADAATTVALVVLHLVVAAVVIPPLSRSLRHVR